MVERDEVEEASESSLSSVWEAILGSSGLRKEWRRSDLSRPVCLLKLA